VAHAFNADTNGKGQRAVRQDTAKTGHYPVYTEGQTVFGLQMVASVLKNVKPQDGKAQRQRLCQGAGDGQVQDTAG